MKIAVFGKSFKDDFEDGIVHMFEKFEYYGIEILIYSKMYDFLVPLAIHSRVKWNVFGSHDELNDNADFIFSIGGDGTLLECVSLVQNKNIPIIGINTGRMGFLADIALAEIDEAVEAIIKCNYKIEERSLIELMSDNLIFDEFNFALNELTIHKKDSASMMTIKAYIDNKFLNAYWADGLIVATPTGSTAYSLSSGGPIVAPDAENFIITPLAPHNLTVRPIVVPDNKVLKLTIEGRSDKFLISLDSRSAAIDSSVEIKLKKADFTVKLLKLDSYTYYNTLRKKLLWGLDMRN